MTMPWMPRFASPVRFRSWTPWRKVRPFLPLPSGNPAALRLRGPSCPSPWPCRLSLPHRACLFCECAAHGKRGSGARGRSCASSIECRGLHGACGVGGGESCVTCELICKFVCYLWLSVVICTHMYFHMSRVICDSARGVWGVTDQEFTTSLNYTVGGLRPPPPAAGRLNAWVRSPDWGPIWGRPGVRRKIR